MTRENKIPSPELLSVIKAAAEELNRYFEAREIMKKKYGLSDKELDRFVESEVSQLEELK
jgi:hypothetical protein